MSQQNLFERSVASLHRAALDDAHWLSAASVVNETVGTRGHGLVLGKGTSPSEGEMVFWRLCFGGQRREDWERTYVRDYWHRDERLPPALHLPDGVPAHTRTLLPGGVRKVSALYNELLPDVQAQHGLNVRMDWSSGLHVYWALCDSIEKGGWSSDQVRTVERLRPHIRSFVSMRQALVDAGASDASLNDLLDNTRTSVIQLDRSGRILAANDVARDILQSREALFAPGGFLRATRHADNAKLQRLLAEALPPFGVHGVAGSMAIRRSALETTLFVHVQPVRAESRGRHTHRGAALVLAVSPASPVWIKPDVVSSAFGLTSTESRIAVMLAAGRTVRDIAAATGRKERTVRWHLQQIFRKQDITRQAELVRRVLSLQSIAGSLEPEPPMGAPPAEN